MELRHPKELEAILASIDDPGQREIAARAFEKLCQGDPNSFPVAFALAVLAVSNHVESTVATFGGSIADALERSAEIAERSSDELARQTKSWEAVEDAVGKVHALATRLQAIKRRNLLLVIALAFGCGVLLGHLAL